MHRDNSERLEATEEMWEDASHPGWDALEAELDAIPPPKMTGKITFGRQKVSRWQLRLARLTRSKRKEYALNVIVHQEPGRGRDGWHSAGAGAEEEEAARNYCREFFEKSGFEVSAITMRGYGAGHGKAIFNLIVTLA